MERLQHDIYFADGDSKGADLQVMDRASVPKANRFLAEFFREPDAHIGFQALGWMTRGQLLCIPMILLGIYLMVMAYHRAAARPATVAHKAKHKAKS